MEGNEPNWKSRCGVLEEQLARFREQAAKVREVIGQKVKKNIRSIATENSLQIF